MNVDHSKNNNAVVVTNSEFLNAVLFAAPRGTSVWVNAFIGNPNSNDAHWGGKAYSPATMANEIDGWARQNTYFSVGAVRRQEDGTLSRRKSHFARLLVLVADDIDPETLYGTPSWGIETSPGKRQIGILLDSQDPDCNNMDLCSRLVTAMADMGMIKADKSGNNVVRYVRLPVGQNQKPRDSGVFNHVVEYWNPNVRYSLEDAASVFGIDLDELRNAQASTPSPSQPSMHSGEQDERLRILTTNIIRGENLHDSINMVAASMVASGAQGGAIVNMLRGLMDASLAPKDDRWLGRYQDIPRSVRTAEEKFRPAAKPVAMVIDQETGELIPEHKDKTPLFTKAGDLLDNIRPVQWLIENYLETDALSMVFGPSGSGKSFVTVEMACCVATGTPWHGMPVRQGAVFYIAGEGHNGLTRRLAAWQKATGIPLKDAPLFISNRAVHLLDGDASRDLAEEVDRMSKDTGHEPTMVAIDTLARNFGAGDENKQQDAGMFIDNIDNFIRKRWKCNAMVVHHSGHEMERARGSSALKGAMDQEIWVKGANGLVEMQVTKMKDAEIPSPKRFKITQVGLGVKDDCDVEITGAFLEVDGNPLDFSVGRRADGKEISALDVAKALYPAWKGVPPTVTILGCSERTLSRILKSMSDQGLAKKTQGSKSWELTDKALNELSMTGFMVTEGAA